jgi:MYXO-CTERM domain-containing protein
VEAFIYYTGGNTDDHRDRLLAAFEQAKVDGLFAGIPGFVDLSGIDVAKGGMAFSSATGQTKSGDDGMSGGAVAGVAIAGVALVLLLLLFAWRRKSNEPRAANGYLQNVDDESCFLDGTSTVNSSEVPLAYNTRSVHVVGEEDSIISEWTGFTPRNKGVEAKLIMNDLTAMEKYGMNNGVRGAYGASILAPENCDVHNCTSSLCEACERSRQRGPVFIPIGEPIPVGERLPANATRVYALKDTVDL